MKHRYGLLGHDDVVCRVGLSLLKRGFAPLDALTDLHATGRYLASGAASNMDLPAAPDAMSKRAFSSHLLQLENRILQKGDFLV